MPTLLTIPREIRDEIWGYCIISPTGYIETFSKKTAYLRGFEGALSSSYALFFHLIFALGLTRADLAFEVLIIITQDCFKSSWFGWVLTIIFRAPHHFIAYATPYNGYTKAPELITLSLPRTCRQIYLETNDLFWKNNTFWYQSASFMESELNPYTGMVSQISLENPSLLLQVESLRAVSGGVYSALLLVETNPSSS
jgi:hypothetical protein